MGIRYCRALYRDQRYSVRGCLSGGLYPSQEEHYLRRRPTGFRRSRKVYIDPVECIDCGACVPVCPVSAIFALDDLPEKCRHYAEIDASYAVGGKFQPDKFKK
jgi:NAD-dependent dihydropyrimidine dehydrogenase PreA subunit